MTHVVERRRREKENIPDNEAQDEFEIYGDLPLIKYCPAGIGCLPFCPRKPQRSEPVEMIKAESTKF